VGVDVVVEVGVRVGLAEPVTVGVGVLIGVRVAVPVVVTVGDEVEVGVAAAVQASRNPLIVEYEANTNAVYDPTLTWPAHV
jgi:UDP-3-O-[3-hydroxymyristoyl] glucosamine N-acyltransferase